MRGSVWEDIEFLERALELVSSEDSRARISKRIGEAKAQVVKSIENEFLWGAISTQTFKNITGRLPGADLVRKRNALFSSNKWQKSLSKAFARKALEDFANKCKETGTN